MTKPTIAVIGGTGAEGSGLAVRWAAAWLSDPHSVAAAPRKQQAARPS